MTSSVFFISLLGISGSNIDLIFGYRDQQCCFGSPALIMGTLHKKRKVLIRCKGVGEVMVPVLVFCTPLKVDHDSSLALRIFAGKCEP